MLALTTAKAEKQPASDGVPSDRQKSTHDPFHTAAFSTLNARDMPANSTIDRYIYDPFSLPSSLFTHIRHPPTETGSYTATPLNNTAVRVACDQSSLEDSLPTPVDEEFNFDASKFVSNPLPFRLDCSNHTFYNPPKSGRDLTRLGTPPVDPFSSLGVPLRALSLSCPKTDLSTIADVESMPLETIRSRLKDAVNTIQEFSRYTQELYGQLEMKDRLIATLSKEIQEQGQRKLERTSRESYPTNLYTQPDESCLCTSLPKCMVAQDTSHLTQHLALLTKENSDLKLAQQRLTQELTNEQIRACVQEREIQQLKSELVAYQCRVMQPAAANSSIHSSPRSLPPLERRDSPVTKSRWPHRVMDETPGDRRQSLTGPEYRRILERQSTPAWETLVERIVQESDQQASLFLQQKLKTANAEQKEGIFKAVLGHIHRLMVNRFGNFLVQRLLECGTPEQVLAIVDAMRHHVLELTFEPFGCHVVQKALDCVQESSKKELVEELLVRIPESITHKYACHVWQKVFELRWTDQSPEVMKHVHQALKGRWAKVAMDETGSLVIQNIFENLTEAEKRPVIDEILQNISMIAKGQWGNWVVQHILEQADNSRDRQQAYQTVLEEAIELSMDQFASKVVEKALRIGGSVFLSQFIEHVSTFSRSHRPRIALVDMASDQYGNYVVQWLINNASDEQKVNICRLIKRHLVSLRGSKYGQRVAYLVEKVLRKQTITTYPTH